MGGFRRWGSASSCDGEYREGAMRFKYSLPSQGGGMATGNFIFYNLGPG